MGKTKTADNSKLAKIFSSEDNGKTEVELSLVQRKKLRRAKTLNRKLPGITL
jgi:hypothetical protein